VNKANLMNREICEKEICFELNRQWQITFATIANFAKSLKILHHGLTA